MTWDFMEINQNFAKQLYLLASTTLENKKNQILSA